MLQKFLVIDFSKTQIVQWSEGVTFGVQTYEDKANEHDLG